MKTFKVIALFLLLLLLPLGCGDQLVEFDERGSDGGNVDAGNAGSGGNSGTGNFDGGSSGAGNSDSGGSSGTGNSGSGGSSGTGNSGSGGSSGTGNSGSGGSSGTGNSDSGGSSGTGNAGSGGSSGTGNAGSGNLDAGSDAGDAGPEPDDLDAGSDAGTEPGDLDSGSDPAPFVTLTSPDDGETDVFVGSSITATFSEAMDPTTITVITFTLVEGTTPVSGDVTFSNGIATFTPDSDLDDVTEYTARISTGVTDLAGNALDLNYEWTFVTGDGTPPTIAVTNPADADLMVAINKTITVSFSETMNPETITFTLMDGVTPISGEVTFSESTANFVAAFNPDDNLAPNTLFTATITSGAEDLSGNALENNYVWTFTTGAAAAQTVAQEPLPLGLSSTFAILASSAITNIPTSMITGDVGLTPDAGSNISGFSFPAACPEVIGTMYAVDATGPACVTISPTVLSNAKIDAQIAFDHASAAVRGTPQAISGDLNGLTLYPGLYESGTSLEISPGGFLYLDAQGDENAVFVIRSETSITTEDTSEVVLTKGAKAINVYWTARSTVTLGTNSIMKGTLVAGTAISLLTGANLEGRALNQGPAAEAITLDACTITVPLP